MITNHTAGFRRVLVCLDRSDTAESALPLAATLSRAENAPLTLVHVLETADGARSDRSSELLDLQLRRAEARAYLERLAAGVDVRDTLARSLILDGDPAERVAQIASASAGALVVLTTRGNGARTGAPAGVVGCTAREILARGGASVLTVPPRSGAVAPDGAPRRILVPLDGSARGVHVLPTVLRLARSLGAEVVLTTSSAGPIHAGVVSRYEDIHLGADRAARLARRAEDQLERVRSRLETSGVRARRVRGSIDDGEELVELARHEAADLVVMSAEATDRLPRRHLGASATHFMEHSDCPLLLLEDGEQAQGRTARWSTAPRRSPRHDAVAGGA